MECIQPACCGIVHDLGQRVKFGQACHRRQHVGREHAHEGRDYACELRVAIGEFLRAVQFIQKEACGGRIARRLEQIVVGAFETPGLVGLQGTHALEVLRLALLRCAQLRDLLQMFKNLIAEASCHGPRLTRKQARLLHEPVSGDAGCCCQ